MKKIILILILINNMVLSQITDITTSNLIGDDNNNGEYGGHGIVFGDCDNDGDPDMYITMNSTSPMADQFFENIEGVFTEKGAERGIDNNIENATTKGSHGWVWADLDNDGDYDGWNGSYSRNIPYMNNNTEPGYFEDMFTTSGIENIELGTRGVTAFDYDNDGDLDLFGNNFYARNQKQENEFYRNDGNFTFTRIDNGLRSPRGDQGVCDGDFDNDGDIDLVLTIFEGNVDGRCVEIMENVNGHFVALQNSGLTLCNASIDGVTFWDMNNDGWLDVVSGYKIFINNHDKTFSEAANVPSGFRFMRGIADINNDGNWDLVDPSTGKVHINNGNLTFTTTTYSTGEIGDIRSVSFADIDGDGDVDFAIGQKDRYNRLYRNDYSGNNRHLFVKLKTADGQAGAYGAKVYLYSVTGDTLLSYRQAHGTQGYLSQDDPVLHFGCATREQVKVKVYYLDDKIIEMVVQTNNLIEIPNSIKIKVFLEGIYLSNLLDTNLIVNIPIKQPYNSDPWNYLGNEEIDSNFILSNYILDWVLIELRNNTSVLTESTLSFRRAVLLRNDGYLIDVNGKDVIDFWGISRDNYYLVISHRNHLSIMSKNLIYLGN